MKIVKFMVFTSAALSLLMALLLIWTEDRISCDLQTAKFLETVFILLSLWISRELK